MGGTGVGERPSSPSLTPTAQPHSKGQSPGPRKPGEHQGAPWHVGRGTEMGKILRAWRRSQEPQEGRKADGKQGGSYMPVVWGTQQDWEARTLLPTPQAGVGGGLRRKPLWPAEGEGPEPGLPSVSGPRVGGAWPRPCVRGGRREGPGPPAPGAGATRARPVQFPWPGSARRRQYVLLVTHHSFPLLSVCRLGKGAGEGEG